MSRFSFRPQVEEFGERCLPSGNPALSIDNVAVVESTTGQQTACVFTVSLSQPSKQTVSVKYATADGTASAADGDYVPTAGTLTFAPGQTAKTITVMVNGDSVLDSPEWFDVNLSGASRASIADGIGSGSIYAPPPSGEYYGYGMVLEPYLVPVPPPDGFYINLDTW
jgi:hypothetical protein